MQIAIAALHRVGKGRKFSQMAEALTPKPRLLLTYRNPVINPEMT
ncbi:hypothetical protein [Phormidium sp. CCY1219]|nr:hypothetical protein [Phormidium sp. CCY1219]